MNIPITYNNFQYIVNYKRNQKQQNYKLLIITTI